MEQRLGVFGKDRHGLRQQLGRRLPLASLKAQQTQKMQRLRLVGDRFEDVSVKCFRLLPLARIVVLKRAIERLFQFDGLHLSLVRTGCGKKRPRTNCRRAGATLKYRCRMGA